MNKSFKQGKLIVILQEFDNTGDKYQINGVDTSSAIFFSRQVQGLYEEIPKGNYKVVNEQNSQYLVITNAEYLSKIERIQIGKEFSSISSDYNVDFNVDINVLKDKYNELVEDVKNMFSYVKKNLMIADGLDVDVVLPQLNTDEVWVKTDDGYKGVSLTDADGELLKRIDEYTQLMQDKLLKTTNEQIARVEQIVTNIGEQNYSYELPAQQKTITLPADWIVTSRLRMFVNGLLLTKNKDYSIADKTITLVQGYSSIADVVVIDDLPPEYTNQMKEAFVKEIEAKTETEKGKLDDYVENPLKPRLDAYEKVKEGELNTYTVTKKQEVTNEGTKQIGLVKAQGDIEIERVKATGLDAKQDKTDTRLQGTTDDVVSNINESFWRVIPKYIGNTTASIDLNNITQAGFYLSTSAANKFDNLPPQLNRTSAAFYMEVSNNGGYIKQVFKYMSFNHTFIRTKNVDSWTGWAEVLRTDSSLFLGSVGLTKINEIQQVGTKNKNQGYYDNVTGKLYICFPKDGSDTTNDVTVTENFIPADNISNAKYDILFGNDITEIINITSGSSQDITIKNINNYKALIFYASSQDSNDWGAETTPTIIDTYTFKTRLISSDILSAKSGFVIQMFRSSEYAIVNYINDTTIRVVGAKVTGTVTIHRIVGI